MKAFVKIKTLILLCKTVSEKSYPMRALQQDPNQPPPHEPSISPIALHPKPWSHLRRLV